jgi:hypothetical protein
MIYAVLEGATRHWIYAVLEGRTVIGFKWFCTGRLVSGFMWFWKGPLVSCERDNISKFHKTARNFLDYLSNY